MSLQNRSGRFPGPREPRKVGSISQLGRFELWRTPGYIEEEGKNGLCFLAVYRCLTRRGKPHGYSDTDIE